MNLVIIFWAATAVLSGISFAVDMGILGLIFFVEGMWFSHVWQGLEDEQREAENAKE